MDNIILIGNPNTGKTTLYNTLTKSNNHVGNWHGVTVDIKHKNFKSSNKVYSLYDLPGIYSLNGYSSEEKLAVSFLEDHKNDLIINIVDANNLSRNLLLTLQLLEQGYNVVLAVNMANEVKDINYDDLSKVLKIPVVPIDARKHKYVKILLEKLNYYQDQNTSLPYKSKLTNNFKQNNAIRFGYIDKLIEGCKIATKPYEISRLDKILFNKYLAVPIFMSVMLLVFAITFGAIGTNFSIIVDNIFNYFADVINDFLCKLNISTWAHTLIMQGLIGGIGVVVSFLPQVTLLFLCMNFLEDTGYLSRVAIMFDGALKKVGLTGKSVFSILLGFGCTTTAMLTTRALDSVSQRKKTALVIPFARCSAKLPGYVLVCSAFFTKAKVLTVFLMYFLGITIGLIISAIASKISKKQETNFIMELPKLRLPTINKTLKNLKTNVFNFVKRVGGTLIVCSVVVWILSNISFSVQYVTDAQDSILYIIANYISVIFKPLGFSPAVVVSLLVGIVAKEMVVSCLSIANGVSGNLYSLATSLTLSTSIAYFTPASALAFLVFILLYSPCISALSVTAKEISRKFAIFVFFFQFAVAYTCALIVKILADLIIAKRILETIIILLVLALICFVVIKYFKKKNKCKECGANCYGKACMQKTK